LSSAIRPFLNLPTRIFGPCRSHMIATVRPTARPTSRTSWARLRWSSAVPCEKFSRTTSTPARTMRSSTAGSLDDGPSVATIFVLRSMIESVTLQCERTSAANRGCLNMQRFSAREHGSGLLVVCFCAAWCDTCDGVRAALERIAARDAASTYVWLDIEDDAALVG